MPNTREKVIELIGTTEYGNGSLVGNNFQKGFIEKIADHLIANGVRLEEKQAISDENKWIPVSERLPEKHGKPYVCWLTFPSGGAFPHILNWHEFGDNGYVKGKHFSDEGLDGMKVTHWMPIPEPPKP